MLLVVAFVVISVTFVICCWFPTRFVVVVVVVVVVVLIVVVVVVVAVFDVIVVFVVVAVVICFGCRLCSRRPVGFLISDSVGFVLLHGKYVYLGIPFPTQLSDFLLKFWWFRRTLIPKLVTDDLLLFF